MKLDDFYLAFDFSIRGNDNVMEKLVAKVIIDNRVAKLDKPFTYLIKDEMINDIKEGMRVVIPFGRGNRLIKGIVIALEEYQGDLTKLKYIESLLDDKPLISKELIKLSIWMSEYYLSPYIDSFNTVLPPGDFKNIISFINLEDNQDVKWNQLSNLETKIIRLLRRNNCIPIDEVKKTLNEENINKDIRNLEEKKLISTSFQVDTKINKKYEKYVLLNNSGISLEEQIKRTGSRAYKQIEIIKYLYFKAKEGVELKKILMDVDTSSSTVKALEQKGMVSIIDKEVLRSPITKEIEDYKSFNLSKAQKHCVDSIFTSIENKDENNKFLIHGVTGSGKTEVYLQLIEKVINMGKQAIVLVPEISLTPQIIERFVGRFGDNVAVLHSRLSFGERFDEWRRIKEGKVKIAVGARSAVFAPFENLGLIVIDEEHETSYKSSMNPKYNAIEVAEKRCELEKSYLVLGTATPSVETYYRAKIKEVQLLNLPDRINRKQMPSIKIIDMREELEKGNKTMFSSDLFIGISENLKQGKQTILFLNRRGYSTFVSCRKCGFVLKCSNCDVSMTYHLQKKILKCHYCGGAQKAPTICPSCKSGYIKYFGIGTQKVEEEVKKYFPKAKVARMDVDTTTRKGSHVKILEKMKKGKIDILIGTQMVAKGLDFPNVTLVGIIAADTSLNLPDFRSSERTFQLITQVAGRAGRGDIDGNVIVQTYSPDHFSIQTSKEHDYINFYSKEIALRKEFEFPPFTNLVSIVIYGGDDAKISSISKLVYNDVISGLKENKKEDVIENIYGPNPAPLERIKNNYRWQI
ncbi:MAG TPA: primosomal protein N', partial [Tissierellales bacterium]|nr:primosomal protein N' [Tissierellales bacterium]